MFDLIVNSLGQFMFFILHVGGNSSFPKPLSAKEEEKYLELFQNGDVEARNILIEHNLRLVTHIIKKYYPLVNDKEDLVSIGTIGMIKAINSFNPEKKIKLSSYASKCIENEILMYFRNAKKNSQDVSLNETIDTDKDGNPLTLMDIMPAEEDIADILDLKINTAKLKRFIAENLSEREREIIIMRYGLDEKKALTQKEVAVFLNISRSYVSRLESKILKKLRQCFENK